VHNPWALTSILLNVHQVSDAMRDDTIFFKIGRTSVRGYDYKGDRPPGQRLHASQETLHLQRQSSFIIEMMVFFAPRVCQCVIQDQLYTAISVSADQQLFYETKDIDFPKMRLFCYVEQSSGPDMQCDVEDLLLPHC